MREWTEVGVLVVAGVLSVFAPAIASEMELGESQEDANLVPAIPDPASQRCVRLGGISRAADAAYRRMRLILTSAHRKLHNEMHRRGQGHIHTAAGEHS